MSWLPPVIACQSAGSTCASSFTSLSVLPVVLVFASSSVSATFSNSDIVKYQTNSLSLNLCFGVWLDVKQPVATTPSVSEWPSVECPPVVLPTLASTSPRVSYSGPLG